MNPHTKEKTVIVDNHDLVAFIEDDEIKIQGDYLYNVPIIDGLVGFLNLDLIEMREMYHGEEGYSLPDHPYIELFPPEFAEETEEAYLAYYDHLAFLQSKFLTLFTFCFDQGFYFDELGGLTADKRLHIYAAMPTGDIPQMITQLKLLDGDIISEFKESKKQSPLEATFSIPAGYVKHIKNSSAKMATQYRLTSTYDALCLEFYQMIERNIKIKKCKNCGRYFLIKNKRNPDYCDRLVGDTTQTCQQIAAVTKFAQKNKNNLPYQVYNKYYKRYHERKEVGTIKKDAFEKWKQHAGVMRNECIDGKRDVVEFEQWCFDSFPNRARKDNQTKAKPMYSKGDVVAFVFDGQEKIGTVYGKAKRSKDSFNYDIDVEDEETIYSRIKEDEICRKVESE